MKEYFKNERGVDEKIIWNLVKRNLIFFDIDENINFITKNKNGKWKNITKRKIDGKNFYACKCGDKSYHFCINNKARDFVIIEGEIDDISCYEIYGKKFNYISTPATTLKGVLNYINELDVKDCKMFFLLDNDEAGKNATNEFIKILEEYTKR